MARVTLNEFTKSVNAYQTIVSDIKGEIARVNEAVKTLNDYMTGEAAKQLLKECKALAEGLQRSIDDINREIKYIQDNNQYYQKNLIGAGSLT